MVRTHTDAAADGTSILHRKRVLDDPVKISWVGPVNILVWPGKNIMG